MTVQDTFDRRLGAALVDYAADAAVEPDPTGFAARIASAHPRSRLLGLAGLLGRQPRLVWLALVLLLVAAAVGAALVGMRPIEGPFRVVVGPPVPDELYGRWQSEGNGARYLDLKSDWLVHEADGRALDAFGRVVAFLPAGRNGIEGTVLIRSSLPCGDASYRLAFDDTPSLGPTAAPAPSASQQPIRRFFGPIRFTEPVDHCPARQAILMSGPWNRAVVRLTLGEEHRSLDFGEPFRFTLPPEAGASMPAAELDGIGVMYQLVPEQLRFSHSWWGAAMIDDSPVFRDLCRHDLGTLQDIPASVDEVGAWLLSTTALRFETTELVIDGRRALRFQARGECAPGIGAGSPSDLVPGSEFYAIPTRDDVILFGVYTDTSNESDVVERLVLAMHFD